ncbi:MAG TPA: GNAT family N-acetyltransferase [Kofleriaceae bacterium]|nr:GNAT family N-acetyltransferase [Kofleriaceae bacterium]
MFVDLSTALRLERAEAHVIQAVAEACAAPRAFALPIGAGVAGYLRPGSPLNKLTGIGLDGVPDDAALERFEARFAERDEPPRVELATLADPALGQRLTARGYALHGFENVLVRRLADLAPPRPSGDGIAIERVTADRAATWHAAVLDATLASDATGVPPDAYTRDVVDGALADFLATPGFTPYLAAIDGALAGGASMMIHAGVAVLTGSATLPRHRRRGVQAALIARRLHDARAAGAELAIITTGPGTQSQANVMKRGFALGHARAILVRATAAAASP